MPIDPMKLSKGMHLEFDDIVEFYMGDCSCDEFTGCKSCKMKTDLMYACIEFARKYQELMGEKCLKVAEDAMERHLTPHYAESIVNEIKTLLGRK